MKIIFDDIIYSLQKAGGISELWSNTSTQPETAFHLIYDNAKENISFKSNSNHLYHYLSSKRINIKRYFNIKTKEESPFIFHSSYYRFATDKNAINVTTVHDFMYEIYRKDFKSCLHKWQKKRAISKSDGIICISENTKRDLLKYYPNTKGRIIVIHNGFDDTEYYYTDKAREKKLVYVGGRIGYKNFRLAVDIAKTMQDYQLIIVGGGELTKKEIDLLADVNYRKIGFASAKELRDIYNRSFALLYTSEYEGFGITPVEAQACGCLVACQYTSSLPEVVVDTACAIDPNNLDNTVSALKKYEDPASYRALQEKGFQNCRRFSWKKCAKEYIEFYQELFAEQTQKRQ